MCECTFRWSCGYISKRRGLTRVKELTEAGCNVSFGTDDIFDPWNPMGSGNMRDPVYIGNLYWTYDGI
ncbi:MAG: amidohydrolase family protein [Holdemanella porci]